MTAANAHSRAPEMRVVATTPSVGVIYNPHSHRNKGRDLHLSARANIAVAKPEDTARLREALEQFAARGIDYLLINGGDGTVREVLTAGQHVFGDHWPEIAVVPKGKTNALNVDLGAPAGWTLGDAIRAFEGGQRIVRRPIRVEALDGTLPTKLGFIFGAGAFTLGVRAGQDAHRLGAFNSLAVAVTTAWGVLQALFGSDRNEWRRGVEMDIRLGEERRALERSALGEPGRREIMLASTLERFPAGIKMFGTLREGLKLVVMDHPKRRLMFILPAIVKGWTPRWLVDWGFRQLAAEPIEIEVGGKFILDGEAFPPGRYRLTSGPELRFVVP